MTLARRSCLLFLAFAGGWQRSSQRRPRPHHEVVTTLHKRARSRSDPVGWRSHLFTSFHRIALLHRQYSLCTEHLHYYREVISQRSDSRSGGTTCFSAIRVVTGHQIKRLYLRIAQGPVLPQCNYRHMGLGGDALFGIVRLVSLPRVPALVAVLLTARVSHDANRVAVPQRRTASTPVSRANTAGHLTRQPLTRPTMRCSVWWPTPPMSTCIKSPSTVCRPHN